GDEWKPNAPGEVCVWEAATGKRVWPAPGKAHKGSVDSVMFSPDGKLLASASMRHDILSALTGMARPPQGEVVIWNAANGAVLHVLPTGGCKAAFSPDGKLLATAGHDMKVRLRNTADCKAPPVEVPRLPGSLVSALVFDPASKYLAAASRHVEKGDGGVV